MSLCHHHDPEPDPASPEALWGNARGCWEAFALLFGTALQLVGEVFIRCTERNQANAYLRGLEALVRRLLLVEAATQPVIADEATKRCKTSDHLTTHYPAHPREGGDPAKQQNLPDPYEDRLNTEDHTLWPAHFALRLNTLLGANLRDPNEPRDPTRASHWPKKHPCTSLSRPLDPPDDLPRFTFAAPIALRFEALRRVIDNPAPYIRRTARALAAFRRRNQPMRLVPAPVIPGDNGRFFYTPLKRIEATAAATLGDVWPDTS